MTCTICTICTLKPDSLCLYPLARCKAQGKSETKPVRRVIACKPLIKEKNDGTHNRPGRGALLRLQCTKKVNGKL